MLPLLLLPLALFFILPVYALNGDQYCSPLMCITAAVNSTAITYTLASTGQEEPGWMALGWGLQMKDTEMVILWANADGSITLSQRKASGDSMPQPITTPSRIATLAQGASIASGTNAQFVFSVPVTTETKQGIIYAFGTTNPGSNDPNSSFRMHQDMGPTMLDLTKTLNDITGATTGQTTGQTPGQNVAPTPNVPSSSTAISLPLSDHEKMILAHGLLCVAGFLFFLPLGALFARYLRTYTHTWYTAHWIIQFAVAAPVLTVGVILGIYSVQQGGAGHFQDSHMKCGIALFVLYYFQCALGAIIHFFKPSPQSIFKGRRPPQNYFHAILGLLLIALGLKQAGDGMLVEWPTFTSRSVPNSTKIVWILWIILLPCLYAVGLAFLPRQFRQEKQSRMRNRGEFDDEMKISMIR